MQINFGVNLPGDGLEPGMSPKDVSDLEKDLRLLFSLSLDHIPLAVLP